MRASGNDDFQAGKHLIFNVQKHKYFHPRSFRDLF